MLYSPPDWEPAPPDPETSFGTVEVTARRGRRHLMCLETSTGTVLEVLVVPPGSSAAQGEEALLAAATPGYAETARSLLDTVSDIRTSTPPTTGRMTANPGGTRTPRLRPSDRALIVAYLMPDGRLDKVPT